MQVEASLKGEYVDEGSLVWRTALYPTNVDLLLNSELEREVGSCSNKDLTESIIYKCILAKVHLVQ